MKSDYGAYIAPWVSTHKKINIGMVEFVSVDSCKHIKFFEDLGMFYEIDGKTRSNCTIFKYEGEFLTSPTKEQANHILGAFYILMLFESVDYWHRTRLVNFTANNFELNYIPELEQLRVHGKMRNTKDIIHTRPLHAPIWSINASLISHASKIFLNKKKLKKFISDFSLFINAMDFSNHTSDAYRISMQIALLEALFEKDFQSETAHDFTLRIENLIKTRDRKRHCSSKNCKTQHSFIGYIIQRLYTVRNQYMHSGNLKVTPVHYKNGKISLWQCGNIVCQQLIIFWLIKNKIIRMNKYDQIFFDIYCNFDHSIDLVKEFNETYPKVRYSFD